MFNKKFFIPLATIALLITACGGKGGKPTSKPSGKTSTSQAPAHVHDYEAVGTAVKNVDNKDVFLKECKSHDDKYIGIAFKDYSDTDLGFVADLSGYTSVPESLKNETKMMEKRCTVSWKINIDKAISGARIEFAAAATSSSSEHQEATLSDRYSAKANDGELAGWDVGSSTTYADVGLNPNSLTYISAQTVDLIAGENTIYLYQGNGGYRLLFGGEVRIHFTGDAVPVVSPDLVK